MSRYVIPEQFDIDELAATDFLMGFTKEGRKLAIPAGALAGAVNPALREDNSAAANGALLSAAVAEANRINSYVKLPSGRFPMQASFTTGALIEWSPSTVLLQSQNAAVLDFDLSGSALGPHTISAFTISENTASSGAATNKVLRLTMSPADAALYRTGDAIMVCSRDARTYYTGDTNYAGETFRVISVEAGAGYVFLNGQGYLYGVGTLYTTTPVAYRLARGQQVRLIGFQSEANGDVYQTGLTGSWPGALQIKAAADVALDDARVNSAWGIGLYLKTCTDARIRVDRIQDLPGDPANGRYGYGILLRGACSNAVVSGGFISRCRHAFTTDCREAASWSAANVWDHGDTTNTLAVGMVSVANFAPPFDTHENSVGTTFRDCQAIGAHYSMAGITAANGIGFNLRGPWDSVLDCRAIDCEGGVNVAATGLIHEVVGENVIDGFECVQEATNNLSGYAISVDGNASETTPQRVSVRNLRPGRGSRGVLIPANATGKFTFDGCIFRGWIDVQVRIQATCTVDMVNCLFDMQEAGTGENCILVDNANTVALTMVNCAVRAKNATTPTLVVTVTGNSTVNLRHLNVAEITGVGITGLATTTGGGNTVNKTGITALT